MGAKLAYEQCFTDDGVHVGDIKPRDGVWEFVPMPECRLSGQDYLDIQSEIKRLNTGGEL